jgi:hypothetical protein
MRIHFTLYYILIFLSFFNICLMFSKRRILLKHIFCDVCVGLYAYVCVCVCVTLCMCVCLWSAWLCVCVVVTTWDHTRDKSQSQTEKHSVASKHTVQPLCTWAGLHSSRNTNGVTTSCSRHWPHLWDSQPSHSINIIYFHRHFASAIPHWTFFLPTVSASLKGPWQIT